MEREKVKQEERRTDRQKLRQENTLRGKESDSKRERERVGGKEILNQREIKRDIR